MVFSLIHCHGQDQSSENYQIIVPNRIGMMNIFDLLRVFFHILTSESFDQFLLRLCQKGCLFAIAIEILCPPTLIKYSFPLGGSGANPDTYFVFCCLKNCEIESITPPWPKSYRTSIVLLKEASLLSCLFYREVWEKPLKGLRKLEHHHKRYGH